MKRSFKNLFMIVMILLSLIGSGIQATPAQALGSLVPVVNTQVLPRSYRYGTAYGLWGVDANHLFVVGEFHNGLDSNTFPLIYQKSGSSWSSMEGPVPTGWTNGSLKSVVGFSADDVYAVGYGKPGPNKFPMMSHWTGSGGTGTWTSTGLPLPGDPGDFVWAELWGMTIHNGTVYAVGHAAGTGATLPFIYTLGSGGVLTQQVLSPPTFNQGFLNAVWSTGEKLFAVGHYNNGNDDVPLLYYSTDGNTWFNGSPSLPGDWDNGSLTAIWGSGPNDIYAVGSGLRGADRVPLLYHSDNNGGSWTLSSPQLPGGWHTGFLTGVWGADTAVYLVGFADYSGSPFPLLFRKHGSQWIPSSFQPDGWSSGTLTNVWGASGNDVYAIGSGTTSDVSGALYPPIIAYAGPDTEPPGAVDGLTATPGTVNGSVHLSWTAPTDDDGILYSGPVDHYKVIYSKSALTDCNSGTEALNPPLPATPGTTQSMRITELEMGEWYNFSVCTWDEEGNPVGPPGGVLATPISALPQSESGGVFDNMHADWTYSSGFTIQSNTSAYQGSFHYSTTPGASAAFTFGGSKFTLLYTGNTNRGNVDVYVDGTDPADKIATINQYNPTQVFQMKWTSGDLGEGIHTVTFVHAGPSGKVMNVDAILIPAGPGTYDNVDINWRYSPGFSISTATGAYQGSFHYTTTVGKYAEFLLEGSQFTLLYTGNANRGLVDVYVDGEDLAHKIGTIDQYSPTQAFQLKWTSGDLGPGTHKVKLVHAGPTGKVINIDAIKVAVYRPPAGGIYDNLDMGWTYSGGFSTAAATAAYQGNFHYSTTVGNSAKFAFEGSHFALLYTGNANRGLVDVYVDGEDLAHKVGTINQYNLTQAFQMKWTSGDLGAGIHTVKLVHAGPAGKVMNIDAIIIPAGAGTYDDLHTSWIYSTGFNIATAAEAYRGSFYYSTTVGSYAEFMFEGSEFALLYTGNTNRGNVDVYVDGTDIAHRIGMINQYNPTQAFQLKWTSGPLGAGVHTVRLVHVGPAGKVINIDAMIVPAGPGTYDDLHTSWNYSTGFSISTATGPYQGGMHYSTTMGSFTEFTFEGTGFTLIYTGNTNRGLVDVYVDGTDLAHKVGTINQFNSPRVWQMTWPHDGLAAGVHTVRFVHAGAAGKVMDIDAIEIR